MAYLPWTPPLSDREDSLTLSDPHKDRLLASPSESDMDNPSKKRKIRAQATEMEDMEDEQALKERVDSLSPMLCCPTPLSTGGTAPEVVSSSPNAEHRGYAGTPKLWPIHASHR
jgi:hypothetical protein